MASGVRFQRLTIATVVGALIAFAGLSPATAASSGPGSFSAPFSEPTVDGQTTEENCVTHEGHDGEAPHEECKPAAGTMSVLSDGRVLYWNALEGTENIKTSIVTDFGTVSIN